MAVYSIAKFNINETVSEKLDVRWSSSETTVSSFKIQWKSGVQEYDSSATSTRQDTVMASEAIEELSSTENAKRYKHTIEGLTDGTEYTVRVIATNSQGDSDPSTEATGTPDLTVGLSAVAFVQNEAVDIFASDYPWLQATMDYISDQNVAVVFEGGASGGINVLCSPRYGALERDSGSVIRARFELASTTRISLT